MEKHFFGTTGNGQNVDEFVIANKNGMEVRCINYGCRITQILLPNKNGGKVDIIQGFDSLEQYEADDSFQGAAVGRYGNRIENAAFVLNGTEHKLEATEAPHFLHGSFSSSVFNAQINGENSICFTLISPDGEQGFPGEVTVEISYTLTDTNELLIDYRAVSTKDTHLCLTNHSYFNLAGNLAEPIYKQTLKIAADSFLATRADLIPVEGAPKAVKDTVFDFTAEKTFEPGITDKTDEQIKIAGGYDHCFVFSKGHSMKEPCVVAAHPASGRKMTVFTTEPAVQLYTMNNGGFKSKGGVEAGTHCAFCLETQHLPNSPNRPDFPSTLLKKGDKYHSITIFKFEF